MTVHSALPGALTAVTDAVLAAGGLEHVPHGDSDPVEAAAAAAADRRAIALIGPYRSADVAEAVEASAPAGLPLVAPFATWAGVTRDDEPGCDDPARHRGTVLRLVARDTVVAARIAAHVRIARRRAYVVAGAHAYGRQLDGQLRLADLPRAARPGEADLVVLAGLAGEPEVALAAELGPLPVIAFDGVQGADLGRDRDIRVALPIGPVNGVALGDLMAGTEQARRAAELVLTAVHGGAIDRASLLLALRRLGPFDQRGDLLDPPVWLWRTSGDWTLAPDRPL